MQCARQPKNESMGQDLTCKKAISHTNRESAHESAKVFWIMAKFKEWDCIYDFIGSNVFTGKRTGDNTNYWAIPPTAGFICFFVSNTEIPFLHYHPSGLLWTEEKKLNTYFQMGLYCSYGYYFYLFCYWCCLFILFLFLTSTMNVLPLNV